ncbi:MAG: TetR/AcrR family transcriptional regulator [Pseudonocardia sp.]
MPFKPESKAAIVERAAVSFNQRGYWGTSMSDLAQRVGTSKGAIYGHVGSKDELAVLAFDHAAAATRQAVDRRLDGVEDPMDWLHAFVDAWGELNGAPAVPGGCPVMKVATEAPEARKVVGQRAREVLTEWVARIRLAISLAKQAGRAREDVDPQAEAEFLFATLEGAGLMARTNGSVDCSRRTVQLLHAHLDTLVPRS